LQPEKLEGVAAESLVHEQPSPHGFIPDAITELECQLLRPSEGAEVVDIHNMRAVDGEVHGFAPIVQTLGRQLATLDDVLVCLLGSVHSPRKSHGQGGKTWVDYVVKLEAELDPQRLIELAPSHGQKAKEGRELLINLERVEVVLEVKASAKERTLISWCIKPAGSLSGGKLNSCWLAEPEVGPASICDKAPGSCLHGDKREPHLLLDTAAPTEQTPLMHTHHKAQVLAAVPFQHRVKI
jgi:hypothetical protein